MEDNKNQKAKRGMDDQTAIAFVCHRFEELHPKSTCPEWLGRCTSIGHNWDNQRRYDMRFCLTPITTNNAVTYFRVIIDPATAEMTVLEDIGFASFVGEQLQGFVPRSE